MKKLRYFILAVFCVIIAWCITWRCLYVCFNTEYHDDKCCANKQWITAGEFGDMFGCLSCLFSGLAFAGLIFTIVQQNQMIENESKERRKNHFFRIVELYLEERKKVELPINGFITVIPMFNREKEYNKESYNKRYLEDIEFYHKIKIQASLFLSALDYVYFQTPDNERDDLKRLLLPFVNINMQRDYHYYLFITRFFPNLKRIHLKLIEDGFFNQEGKDENLMIEWGDEMFMALSQANRTINV